MKALEGLLVADFSRVLAGPYAAMMLGDLGAEVIKVERPGSGDDTRGWAPPWGTDDEGGRQATYYQATNRNKRAMTLDLGDDGDRRLAATLAARADVLIENFRPGTLERYGLGYGQVSVANPGLVYCSITGFGSSPAAVRLSGYDLLVQGMSGLMSVTGEAGGPPMKVGVALVDHITALQATAGVLAALIARGRTGRGQRVEVSLLGSALAAMLNQASGYLGAGVVPGQMGNRHPSLTPYEVFAAADGWFVLACGNDRQFARVAELVGRPELATDERFATNPARVVHRDELTPLLATRLATRPVTEWVGELTAAGVPAGAINDMEGAFATAAAVGLDAVDDLGGFRSVAPPARLSDTPATVCRRPPRLGEHDVELRAWLAADPDAPLPEGGVGL